MKLNERLYNELGYEPYIEPEEGQSNEDYEPKDSIPFEVQEVEGHKVELYYMDDYKNIYDEFTAKGKFAVWSSVDGVNYRLAVEKKYYEKLKDLYSKDVNNTWLNFWDECDRVQKNFTYKIVLPITVVVIALFLFIVNIGKIFNVEVPKALDMSLTLGIPLLYIVAVMILKKNVMKKINQEQAKSIESIKKRMGSKKFEELLKNQRTYIDDFFKEQQEKADKEAQELEEKEAEEAEEAEEDKENALKEIEVKESVKETQVEDSSEQTKEKVNQETNEEKDLEQEEKK